MSEQTPVTAPDSKEVIQSPASAGHKHIGIYEVQSLAHCGIEGVLLAQLACAEFNVVGQVQMLVPESHQLAEGKQYHLTLLEVTESGPPGIAT